MTPNHLHRPKRAMILAAGIGKRMRPLTATVPKPLIEVAGRALIDHALDRLQRAHVETVVVNVHYLAHMVSAHLARRKRPTIVISDERTGLLDTGGGIAKALPLLGDEPFYLLNSDSFWIEGARDNLDWLAGAWNDATMDALIMLAPTVKAVGYHGRGDFRMDPTGKLYRRGEREVVPFAYAGAAILHPRLFIGCPDGAFSLNRLFDKAIEAERFAGMRMDGLWLHVGTPEAIAEAELSFADSAA
jgi:MurNAc alpha-1-phosphate uridylyltransferase